MRHRIGFALSGLAALAVAVAATPATGGTEGGPTSVTTTGDPASGLEIAVTAAPGEANSITMETKTGDMLVRDEAAGITEGSPHCTQPSPEQVRCQALSMRIAVDTLDGADRLTSTAETDSFRLARAARAVKYQGTLEKRGKLEIFLTVRMGPGNDRLLSASETDSFRTARGQQVLAQEILLGSGNDRGLMSSSETDTYVVAKGQAGKDRLIGREGSQRLFGGGAPDFLAGGAGNGDSCNGGPAADKGGEGCEKVVSIP